MPEDCRRSPRNRAAVSRTLLLSEDEFFRAGVKQMLLNSRISVIGEVHDAASLLGAMKMRTSPELVICHIASGRKEEPVLSLIDSLRLRFTHAKFVVLADRYTGSVLPGFVSADVNAVLCTNISGEMLLQSLEFVLFGRRLLPTNIQPLAVDARVQPTLGWTLTKSPSLFSKNATTDGTYQTQAKSSPTTLLSSSQLTARISQRERQVLGCLVRGSTNKCIASELNITEATVKVYMKHLLRKFKAGNRTQLAIWAVHQFAQLDTVNAAGSLQEQEHSADRDSNFVL
jgi:two-component system nitrate/nitrite response regulator NarL